MAAYKGNDITVSFDGTLIAGLREKGISIEGEPIDITDDNSNGWRELLSEPAQRQVTISCSGITKDEVILALVMGTDLDKAAIVTFTDTGNTLTGTFFITGYQKTGTYNDAVTYSFELQSSGEVTYTTV
jgi:TP901-1 family phage major tail protein